MQPIHLPVIWPLWVRLLVARRHGFRFPLLFALLILGRAWLLPGEPKDVATGDPLVDVDVSVYGVPQQL